MQRIHCKFFCNMYISKGENKMDQKLKQDISIGTRIRELRIERHMTQEQVATKLQLLNLDITRSVYSQIENGTYNIRISILAGLAQIFQVDYNCFFRDVHLSIS